MSPIVTDIRYELKKPAASKDTSARAFPQFAVVAGMISLIIGFLLLASVDIALPNFHEDAAVLAVASLRILTGVPPASEGWYPLAFAGRAWPILLTPTVGALLSYAVAPFLAVWGVSGAAFRIGLVVWGALGLLTVWRFVSRLTGYACALIAGCLMATHPSYILWCRDGFGDVLGVSLLWVGVGLAYRWYRGRSSRYLYGACFLWGLGFYNRSEFLLFAIVTVVVSSCWFGHRLVPRLRSARLTIDHWLMCGYAFAAGAAGRLWYHYHTVSLDPAVVRSWWQTYLSLLAEYPDRLVDVVRMFWLMATGGWSAGSVDYLGGPSNFVMLPMLIVLVPSAMLQTLRGRGSSLQRWIAWAGSVLLLSLMLLPLAPQALRAQHLFLLMPFASLAVALWLVDWWRSSRARHQRVLVIGLGLVFCGLNIATLFGYRAAAQRTGGVADFSNAIEVCARDLDRSLLRTPVVGWGFRHRLMFLTEGRVRPVEVHRAQLFADRQVPQLFGRLLALLQRWPEPEGTSPSPGALRERQFVQRLRRLIGGLEVQRQRAFKQADTVEKRLADYLQDVDRVYLFRIDSTADEFAYRELHRLVRSSGKRVQLEKLYRQRDDAPVFGLYSVVQEDQCIDRLAGATIVCAVPEDVQVMTCAIAGDHRSAIVTRPVSEVRIRLRLPQRALLRLGAGLPEHCWSVSDGVLGVVSVVSGGKEDAVFTQYLSPQEHESDRRWFDHRIDLSRFAGQEVELVFRSYPGPKIGRVEGDYSADWFSWANPVVTQGPLVRSDG